jgi:hypothetical protein
VFLSFFETAFYYPEARRRLSMKPAYLTATPAKGLDVLDT